MGTRHLIAVQIDYEYKIAQYGQWDGYPDGQGVKVLEFLQKQDGDFGPFCQKLDNLSFFEREELNRTLEAEYNVTEEWVSADHEGWIRFKKDYPYLSRSFGDKILDFVMENDEEVKLNNSISFAGESVWCEWCYVVDLDDRVFEVYKGFNKNPVTDGRFLSKDFEIKNSYHPVVKVAGWSLDHLPTEDMFLEEFSYEDDE